MVNNLLQVSMVVIIQGTLYYCPPSEELHVHEPSLLFSEMDQYKRIFPLESTDFLYDFISPKKEGYYSENFII